MPQEVNPSLPGFLGLAPAPGAQNFRIAQNAGRTVGGREGLSRVEALFGTFFQKAASSAAPGDKKEPYC